MIRIAICDDNVLSLDAVAAQIDSYFKSSGNPSFDIARYTSPRQLLDDIVSGRRFDIVLLDIIMPETLGTDTARKLHLLDPNTRVVFMTISHDYAVDAYEIGAVHYLVKPLSDAALRQAMNRAMPCGEQKNDIRIVLHMKNSVVQSVDCDDIFYIESIGYRRVVYTKKGIFEETRQTLSALLDELERLSPGRFFCPYRGYIVNLDAIDTIAPDHIVMKDGSSILIKRGDYRRIRDIFFSWTFNNGAGRRGGGK